ALREAAAEPKDAGRLRQLGGLVAVACGVAALVAVALIFPSAATDPKTEAEIVILLIGGAALLSPFLLRWLTREPASRLARPFGRGAAGMLLRANFVTGARRAAAVIVPVLITGGLTMSILGAGDTASAAASAAEHQQAASAGFVVLPSGAPGLTAALVRRIHGIKDVAATAVTDTSMLAYQPQITSLHLESPIPIPFSAMGIDQPSAALNLKVIAGSLAGLGNQTIAVDSSWHKSVGDTMSLWAPDGTPLTLKVIAVIASSLSGPSLVVDLHNVDPRETGPRDDGSREPGPRDDGARGTGARDSGAVMADRVYVRTDSGASSAALLAAARSQHALAVPVSSWSATVSNQQAEQNQVGLELLVGIAVAYSVIGIASTFLMSVGGRRSELALLHKAGAIRRQVAWFVTAESLVLTLIGIVLSAVISGLVLGTLYTALAGEAGSVPVVLPWPLIGAVLAGCVAIAILTSALPAWFCVPGRFRRKYRAYK
ncbi:MAG: ABC transporter permease, partial [Trebonia sp.]